MSRNSKRLSQVQPPKAAPRRATTTDNNPFGISFVVPTSTVRLPSAGMYYSKESALYGLESVEIKQMTVKEEEILSNPEFLKDGTLIDRLVDSIMITEGFSSRELLSGDKNAVILEARKLSYGNIYEVTRTCPNCKEDHIFKFDLEKVKYPEENSLDGVLYDEVNGTFTFTLPQTDLDITVRLLTPEDQEFLNKQNEKAKKLNIDNSETINFLSRCVVSVNDIEEKQVLNKLFGVLPIMDIRKVKQVFRDVVPDLDTKQEVACGGCGHVTESEVPFSVGFFWPDI